MCNIDKKYHQRTLLHSRKTLTTTHQLPIESKNIKENRITVMEISNSKIVNSSHVHYWIVLYT